MLLLITGNYGGLFGKVTTILLNLIPPLETFGELARDVFFGEITNYNTFLKSILYIWILVGVTYIITKVVSKYEK